MLMEHCVPVPVSATYSKYPSSPRRIRRATKRWWRSAVRRPVTHRCNGQSPASVCTLNCRRRYSRARRRWDPCSGLAPRLTAWTRRRPVKGTILWMRPPVAGCTPPVDFIRILLGCNEVYCVDRIAHKKLTLRISKEENYRLVCPCNPRSFHNLTLRCQTESHEDRSEALPPFQWMIPP
jgi:hypothetical protein